MGVALNFFARVRNARTSLETPPWKSCLRPWKNLCLPERGQPYVNAIVLDNRCNQSGSDSFFLAEVTTTACAMDDSGRVCGLTFSTADPDLDLDLDTLNSACAMSNISCTSNCRDGISNAKTLRGCCIHWVNFSTKTPQVLYYGVWNSCGVENPGFCESPLSLMGSAASIVEANHFNLILVIVGSLICQYVNLFMGRWFYGD